MMLIQRFKKRTNIYIYTCSIRVLFELMQLNHLESDKIIIDVNNEYIDLRDLTKKSQFLSKHIMRDLVVLLPGTLS